MGCGFGKMVDESASNMKTIDTDVTKNAVAATAAVPKAIEPAAAPEPAGPAVEAENSDPNVLTVVVSGAAGQIGYSLLPLLANGESSFPSATNAPPSPRFHEEHEANSLLPLFSHWPLL